MRLPKRLVALLLLVACLAAFALPVSAKTFTDLEDHWAKSYMEDLYDRGYLTGYTDNTMRPDEMITACETLVLLSRFYNLTDTEAAYLYEDYGELVEEMVPEDKSWAYDEIALCLAAGIVTEKELGQLDMSLPVAKEYLGVCIIRAMQLTDEAEAFTQSLTFEDTDKIASAYQGYIALLVDMGVVTGDTNNRFNPRSGVSRAVCATMISRALEYAQEQEMNLVIADYDGLERFDALVSGTSGSYVQVCGFDGLEREYVITYNTEITLDGKSASVSGLEIGDYVRVSANNSGLEVLEATREENVKWVWGRIARLVTGKVTHTLYLTDALTKEEATYAIAPTLSTTLNGQVSNYSAMTRDRFVVLKLENNAVAQAYVSSADQKVEGTISQLDYGATVSLKVTGSKSANYYFDFDILDMPAVKRGDVEISIDRLRVGDEVTVQLSGGVVTSIAASGEMSTLTGELTATTTTTGGTFWTIKDSTGAEKQFVLDEAATAKEDGEEIDLADVTIGDKITVNAYDDIILEVTRESASTPTNKVEGTILAVDTTARKVTVLSGTKLIYVKVNVGTVITSAATGNKLTITTIPVGSEIAAYGTYSDSSNFTAVSIILDG